MNILDCVCKGPSPGIIAVSTRHQSLSRCYGCFLRGLLDARKRRYRNRGKSAATTWNCRWGDISRLQAQNGLIILLIFWIRSIFYFLYSIICGAQIYTLRLIAELNNSGVSRLIALAGQHSSLESDLDNHFEHSNSLSLVLRRSGEGTFGEPGLFWRQGVSKECFLQVSDWVCDIADSLQRYTICFKECKRRRISRRKERNNFQYMWTAILGIKLIPKSQTIWQVKLWSSTWISVQYWVYIHMTLFGNSKWSTADIHMLQQERPLECWHTHVKLTIYTMDSLYPHPALNVIWTICKILEHWVFSMEILYVILFKQNLLEPEG